VLLHVFKKCDTGATYKLQVRERGLEIGLQLGLDDELVLVALVWAEPLKENRMDQGAGFQPSQLMRN
jgi:hypothetical protein